MKTDPASRPLNIRTFFIPGGLLLPLLLTLLSAFLRLRAVRYSDLPAGDEINTYIYNAQLFAYHFSLPSLDNFPLTTLVYGVIIRIVDFFSLTLSGVVAHNAVSVMAGMVCTLLVFFGIRKACNERIAAFAAAGVAIYPGTMFVFRADISLYYILMPLLSLALVSMAHKPSYRRAVWPGIIGALFYLSRSDGLFVFFISVFLFTAFYRKIWKMSIATVLVFILSMACYFGLEYQQQGKIGGGARSRAIAAFYQAEGLHDGKGGDWHEYSKRGLERFGPQEEYNNSVFLLMLKNSDAVFERVVSNLKIIGGYLKASVTPPWFAVILLLSASLGRYRRIAALFGLPCLLTSCIYLAFYFQISYFTILSYGLAIGMACGVLTLSETFCRIAGCGERKTLLAGGLVLILLTGHLLYQNIRIHPRRTTSADRYWDALTLVKKLCLNEPSGCFFAPPYGGSGAMPIFMNLTGANVFFGELSKLPQQEQRPLLSEKKVNYLIVGREHRLLWHPPIEGEDLVFMNLRDDVKVVALNAARDFERSTRSSLKILPPAGVTALEPERQIKVKSTPDAIILEATGDDGFVLLPPVNTFDNDVLSIRIKVWSPVETTLKFYFKTPSDAGFDERRSVEKLMKKGMNTLFFLLPVGKNASTTLRLDPGEEAGSYAFYAIEARPL